MTTPLWFGDEELVYLRGTNLLPNDTPREESSLGLQEGLYREQWNLAITELKNAAKPTNEFTWQLYLWAATIFSSRGFTSDLFTSQNENGPFPVLYPVLDIFNHRVGAKVNWHFHNGDFDVCLEERVEQWQQVFNNYSQKGNEDLLMGFGFCIPDNPYDRVAVRLGQIQPEVHRELRNSIPSHWQSEAWEPTESVFYLRNISQQAYCSSIYSVPKLRCLHGIPPELAKSVYIIMRKHAEAAAVSKDMPNEKQIWAGTIDILLQQMEHALMAIARWDGHLPGFPSTAGAKAALIYRTGQHAPYDDAFEDK
ncbi:SET-domain-containing protein [Aspergillus terreus]|uniref:SET-domain-containing protein n=1 Tax=Aspergillus terreus TaxID=33178 RepID=A0A5M3YVZ8_ASPTE|nr:hypothetical protein ATETN484_0005011900 [Aspergillus terreus]GFF16784.1 SET-domain-containing protein [Aspergillus terreus]